MVVLALVIPVLRQRPQMVNHADSAQAILHDQLDEVDRDVARGLISADDGRSAQVEIRRRIIAVDRGRVGTTIEVEIGTGAMIGAGLFVPIAAIALYMIIGLPTIPSAAFAQRSEERAVIADQNKFTQQLLTRLETAEDGGATKDWLLLADTYMRTGNFAGAADAFNRVLECEEATFAEFNGFAEALILQENGHVTPVAERALDRSLQMEPKNVSGVFYKSFALDQAGQDEDAYALLTSQLNTAKGPQSWMKPFIARANFYGRKLDLPPIAPADYLPTISGPTVEDAEVASSLSAEERNALIVSMVERLAMRLEEKPEDLKGWLQLARAYLVLGNETEALSSFRKAEHLVRAKSGTAVDDQRARSSLLSATAEVISGNSKTVRFSPGGFMSVELNNRRKVGEIEFRFTVADGWHINAHLPLDDYLIPTSLAIEGATSNETKYPASVLKSLSFNDAPLALYEGSFAIHTEKSGERDGSPTEARLTFQACSDEVCLTPEDMDFVLW